MQNGGTGSCTAPSSAQIPIAQSVTDYEPKTMSGVCAITSSGVVSCPTLAPLASPTFTGTVTLPDGTTISGAGFTFFSPSSTRTALGAAASPINNDLTAINKTQGITMNQLPAVGTGPTTSIGAGGSIGAATWFGGCSGIDAAGNPNAVSALTSVTTVGSGNSVTWTCATVAGATSYRLYTVTNSSTYANCKYFNSSTASVLQSVPQASGTTCPSPPGFPGNNLTGQITNLDAINTLSIYQSSLAISTGGVNIVPSSQTGANGATLGVFVSGVPIATITPSTGIFDVSDSSSGSTGGIVFDVTAVTSGAYVTFNNDNNSTCAFFDQNDVLWLSGGFIGAGSPCSGGQSVPEMSMSAVTTGHVACIKSAGPPVVIGTCTGTVNTTTGACGTCS